MFLLFILQIILFSSPFLEGSMITPSYQNVLKAEGIHPNTPSFLNGLHGHDMQLLWVHEAVRSISKWNKDIKELKKYIPFVTAPADKDGNSIIVRAAISRKLNPSDQIISKRFIQSRPKDVPRAIEIDPHQTDLVDQIVDNINLDNVFLHLTDPDAIAFTRTQFLE